MEKRFKRSKAEILVFILILIVLLVGLWYVWREDEIADSYACSSEETIPESAQAVAFFEVSQTFFSDQRKLNSLELLVGNAEVYSSGGVSTTCSLMILKEDTILYQSEVTLSALTSNEWYRLYVNIPLTQGQEYEIVLRVPEDSAVYPVMYIVPDDAAPGESLLCELNGSEQEGQLLIRYGYLMSVSVIDKLISSALWVLAALLLATALFYRQKIMERIRAAAGKWKNGPAGETPAQPSDEFFLCGKSVLVNPASFPKVCLLAAELLLCYVLVEGAGIEFQVSVKALLYLLSLVSAWQFERSWSLLREKCRDRTSRISFCAVVILAAFAFVGNRTLVYPLDLSVTLGQLVLFLAAMLWFVPPLALFEAWYTGIHPSSGRKMTKLCFALIAATLLLIPCCVALYAFNPGITSEDTQLCLYYAHNIYGMPNWHPPFYVLILRLIIKMWDSTYAVILVQFFFWAYVMVEGLLLLRNRGIPEQYLLAAAFLLGVSPANYVHLCTIWKDVPYTLSLLWMTILIARLLLQPPQRHRWYFYLEFVTAAVFTFFLRQNGMVVYILVMAFLVVLLRRSRGLMAAIAVSAGLVLFIRFPVYSHYEISKTGASDTGGGIYTGLAQDILGVYYSGGDLSEESLEIVRVFSSENMGEFNYDPYRAGYTSYDLSMSIPQFIRCYLDTFFQNPVIMAREIFIRQDFVWDLFGGEGADPSNINFYSTQDQLHPEDSVWTTWYPARQENSYTYAMIAFQEETVDSQLLKTLTWSTGIYTLLTTFAFLALILKKRVSRNWLLFLPFAGQVLSLMLSTGWNDFRYYWPLNLLAVFLLLLIPTLQEEQESKDEHLDDVAAEMNV